MKKNRKPEVPVDDYTVGNAVEIGFHGLKLAIMPRYQEHFVSKKYEDFSMAITKNFLKNGMRAIDVGAHMGAFSVVMSQQVGSVGSVYSYEPVPENRELLTRNLELNKFTTKNVRPYAIGDSNGEVSFNIPWASDSAGLYEHPNAETIRTITVGLRTLDDLHKGEKIDFIKIDTEGNEIKVLQGAKTLLKNNPNLRMLVEFNPECLEMAGVIDAADFFTEFHHYGFRTLLVNEDSHSYCEVLDPSSWKDAMNGREYVNVYCVPKSTKVALVMFHTPQFGGGELVAQEQAEILSEEGWLIQTVFPEDGPMSQTMQDKGYSVKTTPYLPWCRQHAIREEDLQHENYINSEAVLSVMSSLTDVKTDLVVSHTLTTPWAALAASALSVAHIWDVHEFGNKTVNYNFDYDFNGSVRIISDLSDTVIVHSMAMRDHFASAGVEKEKLVIVPIGVRQTPKIISSERAKNFAVIGRITDHKNQLFVVNAFAKALHDNADLQLLLVGSSDKDYRKKIDSYVQKHNLHDNVRIQDYTEDIDSVLQKTDVLIMATDYEPFGRVTAEAIYAGIPVLGSNGGATPEIVRDGVDGLLFKSNDVDGLAQLIGNIAKSDEQYKLLVASTATNPIRKTHEVSHARDVFMQAVQDTLATKRTRPYGLDKLLPSLLLIQTNLRKEIHNSNTRASNLENELAEAKNNLLKLNHRVEQLRKRFINKSFFRYLYEEKIRKKR